MCNTCLQVPVVPEEGNRSPGSRVTGSVSHPKWVLRTRTRSFERAASTLNCWAISTSKFFQHLWHISPHTENTLCHMLSLNKLVDWKNYYWKNYCILGFLFYFCFVKYLALYLDYYLNKYSKISSTKLYQFILGSCEIRWFIEKHI